MRRHQRPGLAIPGGGQPGHAVRAQPPEGLQARAQAPEFRPTSPAGSPTTSCRDPRRRAQVLHRRVQQRQGPGPVRQLLGLLHHRQRGRRRPEGPRRAPTAGGRRRLHRPSGAHRPVRTAGAVLQSLGLGLRRRQLRLRHAGARPRRAQGYYPGAVPAAAFPYVATAVACALPGRPATRRSPTGATWAAATASPPSPPSRPPSTSTAASPPASTPTTTSRPTPAACSPPPTTPPSTTPSSWSAGTTPRARGC